MMTAQRVRETFLQYFAERGHKVVRSSPLSGLRWWCLPSTHMFSNSRVYQLATVGESSTTTRLAL